MRFECTKSCQTVNRPQPAYVSRPIKKTGLIKTQPFNKNFNNLPEKNIERGYRCQRLAFPVGLKP